MRQKEKEKMLDNEINNISEKLDVDLTTLRVKCKFFERAYEYDSIEKERELRKLAKKKNKLNKKTERGSRK